MERNNLQQPGPSGYNQNKSKSKQEQKEASKYKIRFWTKRKSNRTSIANTSSRRYSSIDATPSRYKMVVRPTGMQASHTVRNMNITPNLHQRQTKIEQPKKLVVHSPEPKTKDEHEAADIYFRGHHLHRRESLMNMRNHARHVDIPRHRGAKGQRKSSEISAERCRNCFERIEYCICAKYKDQSPGKSDWSVIVQPLNLFKKKYTEPSFQWFIELENSSKVDKQKLLVRKKKAENDMWILPFLWKREQSTINYYLAH